VSGGIDIASFDDSATVQNSTAVGNRGNGIQAIGPISGLTLLANRAIANRGVGGFTGDGIHVTDAPSATIQKNETTVNKNDGIFLGGSTSAGAQIAKNTVNDNRAYGIENASPDVKVSGNT